MTLYLTRTDRAPQVRFFPIVVWLFCAMILWTIGQLLLGVVGGSRPLDGDFALAFGLLSTLGLLVGWKGGAYVECRFDRKANRVTVRRIGLHGISETQRPLSELRALRLVIMRRAYAQLELAFISGERVGTTDYYVIFAAIDGIERLAAQFGVSFESDVREQRRFG